LSFEPPMLFAIGFLFMFTIGGFSGVMLAIVPADFQYRTATSSSRISTTCSCPGAVFAIMGAVYYWMPKWTGHMYNMTLAKTHFWLSTIFVNVLFFPQHFLGLAGMPRRVPDYAVQFSDWNMVSSIGGFGFGLVQILFAIVVIQCIRGGKKASAEVWDGARPIGLEWTVAVAGALSQLHDAAGVGAGRYAALVNEESPARRGGFVTARLALMSLALGFYVAFIALSIYRNRH
jgi:cytochrome c oxidase subunit 1